VTAASRDVHVLVLVWNGWEDALECLESLLRVEHPRLRVIVCDNASPNGSLERIREWAEGRRAAPAASGPLPARAASPVPKPIPFVEYSREEAERGGAPDAVDVPLVLVQTGANLGFAGGNNVGLRYLLASGAEGFVWLLNNDMVVAPDVLEHLLAAADTTPAVGAVGATILDYVEPDRVQEAAGGIVVEWHGMVTRMCESGRTRETVRAPLARLDYVSGGCLLAPLDVVRRVGLLDERFFLYAEDIEWSLRMRAAGFALAWAPRALVWHKGGRSAVHGSPLHDYHYVRSSLLLARKLRPRMLPLALAWSAVRCGLPKLARGEWRRLDAVWRAGRDAVRIQEER